MITAIVLAAGESRRMGRLKPLLPFGTRTVIETVVDSLKASPVDEILVVTGYRSEELAAVLAPGPARVVRNPDHQRGMLSSIQCGVAAAEAGTTWFLIALADQPQLRPEVVRRLLDATETGRGAYIPVFGERRGHPILIHASWREAIAHLDPAVGLRQLWALYPEHVRHVPVESDTVLQDMDTPDDYAGLLARRKG